MEANLRNKFSQLTSSLDSEEGWIEVGLSSAKVDMREKSVQTNDGVGPPTNKSSQTEQVLSAEVILSDKPVQTDTSNSQSVVQQDKWVQTGDVLEDDLLQLRPLDQCIAIYKATVTIIDH